MTSRDDQNSWVEQRLAHATRADYRYEQRVDRPGGDSLTIGGRALDTQVYTFQSNFGNRPDDQSTLGPSVTVTVTLG